MRLDKFTTKLANVHEVFTTSFTSNVTAIVKVYLDAKQPRRALYELDRIHAPGAAGPEGHILLQNQLSTFTLRGTDVSAHLENFDYLVAATSDAGYNHDDSQLLVHLTNSFKNSENRNYDTLLENADSNDWTYAHLRDKILKRFSNLQLKASSNRSSNENSTNTKSAVKLNTVKAKSNSRKVKFSNNNNNNNQSSSKPQLKCTKCKRNGHTAANCWGNNACPHCGTKNFHHNPDRCPSKPDSNEDSDDDNEDAEPTTTPSSSSSSTNNKVNLSAAFQNNRKKARAN